MADGHTARAAIQLPGIWFGALRRDRPDLINGIVAMIGVAAGVLLTFVWERRKHGLFQGKGDDNWLDSSVDSPPFGRLSVKESELGERSLKQRKPVPKRLILIRHGESEGNVDRDIYKHTADHGIHLTERGWHQALAAGMELHKIVGKESVKFFVSPYVRTRETFHAIAKAWGGHEKLSFVEDPRIREQDFGNFQDPPQMLERHAERKKFGVFYYRFPDGGESCADVYDRVSSFMESLYRHWREHPDICNYVIVCHGLTIATFLMRWFKYSVDEFHSYEHFTNCEFIVLERDAQDNLRQQFLVRNDEDGTPQKYPERARKPTDEQNPRQMRMY